MVPADPCVFYLYLRFPGQQTVGGDSKIPSVVCYDADGEVVAVGSETDPEANPEIDGLSRAEWYSTTLFCLYRVLKRTAKVQNASSSTPLGGRARI